MLLPCISFDIYPLQTLRSFIKVFAHPSARFCVTKSKQFQECRFYLSRHGLFSNFTNEADQLMRGNVPWRRPWKKHQSFFQMLIEAFMKEGNIILDWQASTSISCSSSFHFLPIVYCFEALLYRALYLILSLIFLPFVFAMHDHTSMSL